MSKAPRVAIVHDWLVGGGAERVVQALHEMYPDAPIYTSYATKEWRAALDGKVVTGWLQHLGFMRRTIPFLITWWFSRLDLTGYDLVISSSGNGGAKAVRVKDGTTHVCYCHTPTHYYWRHYNDYMANPGFGPLNPLARLVLRLFLGPLRAWDLKASKRPHHYIANSTHIKNDIQKYYGRDAQIVHPPVAIERFKGAKNPERHGFITAGRLVPYKRVDLIIKACNELDVPLTIVGRGPELQNLKAIAGPTITFRTDVTDEEMPAVMASAKAFIFAAHEDFGITPVEAMACGTPVIAYKAGGALDYVVEGKSGTFFIEQSSAAIAVAIKKFPQQSFSASDIKTHAKQFSTAHFKQEMAKTLQQLISS